MNQDTLNTILQIILLVVGGGLGGGAVVRVQKSGIEKTYKQLFEESNDKRLELVDKVEALEKNATSQQEIIARLTARLDILGEEREKERQRYQTERDEIMQERGKISAQLEHLTSEIDQLREALRAVREKNEELKKTNDKLEEYREIAQAQKRQLDEAKVKQDELSVSFKNCQERTRFLESQLEAARKAADKEDAGEASAPKLPKTGTEG